MSLTADSPVNSSSSSSSDDFAAFLDAELESASDVSQSFEGDDEVEEEEEEKEEEDDEGEEEAEDGDGDDDDHDIEAIDEKERKPEQEDSEDYSLGREGCKSLPSFVGLDFCITVQPFRCKRRKVDIIKSSLEIQSLESVRVESSGAYVETGICAHPGVIRGLCIKCGEWMDDESGVALGYIHKNLRLSKEELIRLRDKDLRSLLRHRKLYLVLDLDHTLLNSSPLYHITGDEEYLKGPSAYLPDSLKNSMYRLESMRMMTKLRPFVHTFLKEASKMFEMYIYTMGDRNYALAMAKLLDPEDMYFNSRVIANVNNTVRNRKGLDVVLGKESAVLILDDTEKVWEAHLENLILMERYHFFASSVRQFQHPSKSLSQLRTDENETHGALATVLRVLEKIHTAFYNTEVVESLLNRDVRQLLKKVRSDVLKGCKLLFSRVFPTESEAENQHHWKLAVQLGATCSTELDPSITHVVSWDSGTEKSRWAIQEKKYLVNPRWIEAARFLWRKQPEEQYPVTRLEGRKEEMSLHCSSF